MDSFIISNKYTELVITDPKAVAHVLKNNADNYIKNTVVVRSCSIISKRSLGTAYSL